MKKWNWKIFRRVVMILLAVSIVCVAVGGCKQTKTAETYDEARPWIKLKWEDKAFPVDNVTLSLSIGLFLNTENPADLPSISRDIDSFYGAALYFCSADNAFLPEYNFADYPLLENHTLIKEIPAEDALSNRYKVKKGFLGKISYNHTEQITVPKELFAENTDSIFIKLILIGIKDGQYVTAAAPMSIGLSYQFTDDNCIRFTSPLLA